MKQRYTIKNIDCASCARAIESALETDGAVRSVSIDVPSESLLIDTDDIEYVRDRVRRVDSAVSIVTAQARGEPANNERKEWILVALSIALLVVGVLIRRYTDISKWIALLPYLASYSIVGYRVVFRALRNIRTGQIFDENFLMTIATIGAFIIDQPFEAVAVMLFYRVGDILQERSVERSRRSIFDLLDLQPDTSRVVRDDSVEVVATSELQVGDLVEVRPGERFASDGAIVSGEGFSDTSAITGEPEPRRCEPGTTILAGFLSLDTLYRFEVTATPDSSSAAKIVELVERATHVKAGTERFITRFARIYTPLVVGVAALIAVIPPLFISGAHFETWIYRALTMLVISCPCALVLSIPLTYFAGVGGASAKGILVKGAAFFEVLARITTFVFDKTGTVTKGEFAVQKVVPVNGYDSSRILELAGAAESRSNHPIAQSILKAAEADRSTPLLAPAIGEFEERRGYGVIADVDGARLIAGHDRLLHEYQIEHSTCNVPGTVVHLAVDDHYAGYILVGDRVREGASEIVESLKSLGVRQTVLLTGDRSAKAEEISGQLGIDIAHGDLLPEEKVDHMERLIASQPAGESTAYLGDGINDAPVIARADVGIAMGINGTAIAIDSADVVLMNEDPSTIGEAIRRAKKTRQIVLQNIVGALAIKAVFLSFGALGLAGMLGAVVADVGVTVVAVLNAARALR